MMTRRSGGMATAVLPLLLVCVVYLGGRSNACLSSGVCGSSCYSAPAQSCVQSQCQPGYTCGAYGCARTRAKAARQTGSVEGIVLERSSVLSELAKPEVNAARSHPIDGQPSRNIFGLQRRKPFQEGRKFPADDDEKDGGESGEGRPEEFIPIPRNKLAVVNDDPLANATYAQLTNPNWIFARCCEERSLPDACLSKCNFNAYTRDALQGMYFKSDGCPLAAASDMQFCAAQGRDHTACCARNQVGTTVAGGKCLTLCDQRPGRVTPLDYSYLPCFDRFENIKRCFYSNVKQEAERLAGERNLRRH